MQILRQKSSTVGRPEARGRYDNGLDVHEPIALELVPAIEVN